MRSIVWRLGHILAIIVMGTNLECHQMEVKEVVDHGSMPTSVVANTVSTD